MNINITLNLNIVISVIVLIAVIVPTVVLTTQKRTTVEDNSSSSFYIVPLGTTGGLEENNLSCYLITSVDNGIPNSDYITFDGGTLRHGIESVVRIDLVLVLFRFGIFIKIMALSFDGLSTISTVTKKVWLPSIF